MTKTFGVDNVLAAMGLTGASAVQEYSSAQNIEFASVQDNYGNTIQDTVQAFNNKYEKTITVKMDGTADGDAMTFNLGGAGTSNLVITSASIRYVTNDYPTITVTAHQHTGNANTHATAITSGDGQNQWTIADVPLTFGIPAVYLVGTGIELADCQSCELTFSCEHVDKLNNAGLFLTGTSYNARCECSEEYVSDSTGVTPTDTWNMTEFTTRQVNTDFRMYSARGYRHDVESVI